MRRFFLLLLALLLLPVCALCETGAERLAQLDIISQRDPRLQEEKYFYQDMVFRIAGCKPASVTNALVALLGTPETDVPRLLLELRRGLTYDANDKKAAIELWRLPDQLRRPRESAVQLRQMLAPVTSIVLLDAAQKSLLPADLVAAYAADENAHPLFLREMTVDRNWAWLAELSAELCRQGHPDARFVLCAASAGTDESGAPLRSGSSGHYISMYFTAGEFHQDGTMYLLDSLPRALEGDIYGYFEHYPSRYPFVYETRKPFAQHYSATRIIDPVLQFTLNDRELALLHSLSPAGGDARIALQARQCETLTLFMRAYFMLYIP
ncbi:MAG: hypothetical protein ACI4WX_02200 [Aristaeellaceae bacterium]